MAGPGSRGGLALASSVTPPPGQPVAGAAPRPNDGTFAARAGPRARIRDSRAAVRQSWDRFTASDPGLLRTLNATTVVGGILLTLSALALLHTPTSSLVVGGMAAMVASFAISDPRPRDQAITLALGLPLAIAAITVGTLLYGYRAASDAVFVAVIFAAVYVRRFGPRGTGLGLIGFQCYFVSQFAHATPALLPRLWVMLAVAFAASALMRFGVVRNTPQRTLARLYRAFSVRLAALIDSTARLAADGATESRVRATRRRAVRVHQCALMIQARLETALADPDAASLTERRVAESQVAAERVARLVLRALTHHPGRSDSARQHALSSLSTDLDVLAALVAAPISDPRDAARAEGIERVFGYRDGAQIPSDDPKVRDAYQAVGELARAIVGLRDTVDLNTADTGAAHSNTVDEDARTIQSGARSPRGCGRTVAGRPFRSLWARRWRSSPENCSPRSAGIGPCSLAGWCSSTPPRPARSWSRAIGGWSAR